MHEYEQLPAPKPLAQVPEVPPLFVALTLQLPFSVVAVQAAAAQVSLTSVHTPLVHEYEQLPVPKPLAQVPEVLPLFVALTLQLPFSVAGRAGRGGAGVGDLGPRRRWCTRTSSSRRRSRWRRCPRCRRCSWR